MLEHPMIQGVGVHLQPLLHHPVPAPLRHVPERLQKLALHHEAAVEPLLLGPAQRQPLRQPATSHALRQRDLLKRAVLYRRLADAVLAVVVHVNQIPQPVLVRLLRAQDRVVACVCFPEMGIATVGEE